MFRVLGVPVKYFTFYREKNITNDNTSTKPQFLCFTSRPIKSFFIDAWKFDYVLIINTKTMEAIFF